MNSSRTRLLTVAVVVTAFALGAGLAVFLQFGTDSNSDATSVSSGTTTSGAAEESNSTTEDPLTTQPKSTTTTTVRPGVIALADIVAAMSPEEKARQVLVIGLSGAGPSLASSPRTSTGSMCVGGVFVARNWAPQESLAAATETIAAISSEAESDSCVGRPLIITDAEAGTRVLKVPVDPLPSPADLLTAHVADSTNAVEELQLLASEFATQLRAAGVHANFGVIADVDVDSTFYMARQERSFGGDPASVSEITGALVEGHCRAGVAATLKHFPNQGATPEDPHGELSRSADDVAAWQERGMIPYVGTTAPMVMTGHILFEPDAERPASLSRAITTGLLRDELAYQGVIVTDDLSGMRGITTVATDRAKRTVDAIAAGADLALFVDDGPFDREIDAIVSRAEADPEFARQLDASVARVLRLKASLGLLDGIEPSWFPLCTDQEAPYLHPAPASIPAVVVANGTGKRFLAGDTASRLPAGVTGHATTALSDDVMRTVVYFEEGHEATAADVATALGIPQSRLSSTSADLESLVPPTPVVAAVVVLLGSDFDPADGVVSTDE